MTRYSAGDVVLVRFPFTELTSSKKRPAVVLSPAEYSRRHGDVVVMALTSQDPGEPQLQLRGWRQAGLPKPTWCKPLIATVSTAVIERGLGRLTDADRSISASAVALAIHRTFRES